jgi:hypothetical protein
MIGGVGTALDGFLNVRAFQYSVGHTQDTYGQMVVYLRLNGLVPPASQRP